MINGRQAAWIGGIALAMLSPCLAADRFPTEAQRKGFLRALPETRQEVEAVVVSNHSPDKNVQKRVAIVEGVGIIVLTMNSADSIRSLHTGLLGLGILLLRR